MNTSIPTEISIIIPVFNGADFICECLDSINGQTFKGYEVILVDDGSTDRSVEIAEKHPLKKTIIRQKNGDVSLARNTGIQHSTGQFIAFLDQDDLWFPDKLEKQLQVFNGEPEVDLVFTDLVKFYPSGKHHHAKDKHRIAQRLTDSNYFQTLVMKNVLMPSTVMVRRESIETAGLFNASYRTCGDYELWLRMAAMGMKFRYIPEILTKYRYHGANTSKMTEIMHEDRVRAVSDTFRLPYLAHEYRKLEKTAMAKVIMNGANTFYSNGQYEKFLENFYLALQYSKTCVTWKVFKRWMITILFRKKSTPAGSGRIAS